MVGTTGIEPVTPTMSTQRADGKYREIRIHWRSKSRERSRSDHGNLGHFLGHPVGDAYAVFERGDGLFALGWHDDAPGPFATRQFAAAVAAKTAAAA